MMIGNVYNQQAQHMAVVGGDDPQHTSFVGSVNGADVDAVDGVQLPVDSVIREAAAPVQRKVNVQKQQSFFSRLCEKVKDFFDLKPDLFAGIVTFTIGIVTFNPVVIGVGAGLIGFFCFRKLIAM